MSSRYLKSIDRIYEGGVNLATDSLRFYLLKASHTPNFSTNEFLSDIVAGDRITNGMVAVSGQTFVDNVFDCTDPIFPCGTAGESAGGFVLVKWTGVEATSPLLFYFNSQHYPFPMTTTVGTITVLIPPGGLFTIDVTPTS